MPEAFTVALPAHPRVGGENRLKPARGIMLAGSSPRRRGKLAFADGGVWNAGLIPA